jgi:hypothetical protein
VSPATEPVSVGDQSRRRPSWRAWIYVATVAITATFLTRTPDCPTGGDCLDSGIMEEECQYSDLDLLLLITTLFLVLLSAALVGATLARHVARR